MPALCHDPQIHNEGTRPQHTDLRNLKEEDREELIAIRFPTNVNKTEDLGTRVVS